MTSTNDIVGAGIEEFAPRRVVDAPPAPSTSPVAPVLDIVIPVHNEQPSIAASVRRVHAYLASLPYTWRITIADNASTDGTWTIAEAMAAELDNVATVRLDTKGRGRALRTAWTGSDAAVLVYMDVDLSTDLDALLPLVAPLISGHSDLAIGSRHAATSAVARGPRREVISRSYNLLLRTLFATRFRDAQCGFKAIRADVAKSLVPRVVDDEWFFDTELLLLAEHNGLRIHEVPVDWVDDPDSRVNVRRTAIADLKGVARMSRRFLGGHGDIEAVDGRFSAVSVPVTGRQLLRFGLVGSVSTAVSLAMFLVLSGPLGAIGANAVAVTATALLNTWSHRRFTFVRYGRASRRTDYLRGLVVLGCSIALGTVVLAITDAGSDPGKPAVAALLGVWAVAALVRFRLLRRR